MNVDPCRWCTEACLPDSIILLPSLSSLLFFSFSFSKKEEKLKGKKRLCITFNLQPPIFLCQKIGLNHSMCVCMYLCKYGYNFIKVIMGSTCVSMAIFLGVYTKEYNLLKIPQNLKRIQHTCTYLEGSYPSSIKVMHVER